MCYFSIDKKHSLMADDGLTHRVTTWVLSSAEKAQTRVINTDSLQKLLCSTQVWLLKAQTLSPQHMQTATDNYIFPERLLTVCSLSMKFLQRSSHSHTVYFDTTRSYHQVINSWYIKDNNKCLCSRQKTVEEEKKKFLPAFSFFL